MKLEELTNTITDYVANGSFASLRENAKYVDKANGYARVIRLTDENNNYSEEDAIYVSKLSYDFLSKSKLEAGDIIVTNVGAYLGTVFQCPDLHIPMTLGPNAVLIKPNNTKVSNKYLYYLLYSEYGHNKLISLVSGSAMPKFNKTDLRNMDITIHTPEVQQHIINTIGSVDDLIENINKQNEKLLHIGLTIINGLNGSLGHQKLSSICELAKGLEIGSQNYIETLANESLIHYLRVGDLLSLGSTFVEPSSDLMLCSDDDILIAFDGAPGRNAIGLEGAYSSGIYKVNCNLNYKGLIYFEINSELNQKIIKDHSQGTTILHASKAIPFLEIAKTDEQNNKKLNVLFKQIIKNKKKLKQLNNEKRLLLSKYF